MAKYYRLNPDRSISPTTADEWMASFAVDKNLFLDEIGDVRVSTIFLGLDHGHGYTLRPLLFETMIFGGEHDQYQERCSTYDGAIEMHRRAVSKAAGNYDETRDALRELRTVHRKTLDGLGKG